MASAGCADVSGNQYKALAGLFGGKDAPERVKRRASSSVATLPFLTRHTRQAPQQHAYDCDRCDAPR
jgi:hypothetical protein